MKKFLDETIHFYKFHKLEMILFFLIYVFCLFPSYFSFMYMKQQGVNSFYLMILLLSSNIPASIFCAYSLKHLGFKKYNQIAIQTFFLLSSSLFCFINFEYGLFPRFYTFLSAIVFVVSMLYSFFDSSKSNCGCSNSLS